MKTQVVEEFYGLLLDIRRGSVSQEAYYSVFLEWFEMHFEQRAIAAKYLLTPHLQGFSGHSLLIIIDDLTTSGCGEEHVLPLSNRDVRSVQRAFYSIIQQHGLSMREPEGRLVVQIKLLSSALAAWAGALMSDVSYDLMLCRSCVPCSQTQSSCPTSIVRWAPKLEDVCRSISNDPRDHHRRVAGTCFNWVFLPVSFNRWNRKNMKKHEKNEKHMKKHEKNMKKHENTDLLPRSPEIIPQKMDPCDVWSLWHFRSLRVAGRLLCLRLHYIENDCVDIDDYVALGSIFQLVSDGSKKLHHL